MPSAFGNSPTKHIIYITGPAGCGKTTVAKAIAEKLDMTYVEGDDYHSQENKDKMAHGKALTDDDRAGWLAAIRDSCTSKALSPSNPNGIVATCSALKKCYRDTLRDNSEHKNVETHFILLEAGEEELIKRVSGRKNHYMGADMVKSQLEILEMPTERERDVMVLNCEREEETVASEACGLISGLLTSGRGLIESQL